MPVKIVPFHRGGSSEVCRMVQAAAGRRLRARGLASFAPDVDGSCGPDTIRGVSKAAWALGAQLSTVAAVRSSGEVPVGVSRMILNPGNRSDEQKARARARIAQLAKDRKDAAAREHDVSSDRLVIVRNCLQAATNYRANPGLWHYLAGGVANLIYLRPSPRNYRSDCSQFASAAQHDSGLPDLGPNGPLWVNTDVMDGHLEPTDKPLPGDFGMYGRHRGGTHHVEVYLGAAGGPGHEFVGHGSPPVDSLTPGRPDFYLRNPVGQ